MDRNMLAEGKETEFHLCKILNEYSIDGEEKIEAARQTSSAGKGKDNLLVIPSLDHLNEKNSLAENDVPEVPKIILPTFDELNSSMDAQTNLHFLSFNQKIFGGLFAVREEVENEVDGRWTFESLLKEMKIKA